MTTPTSSRAVGAPAKRNGHAGQNSLQHIDVTLFWRGDAPGHISQRKTATRSAASESDLDALAGSSTWPKWTAGFRE